MGFEFFGLREWWGGRDRRGGGERDGGGSIVPSCTHIYLSRYSRRIPHLPTSASQAVYFFEPHFAYIYPYSYLTLPSPHPLPYIDMHAPLLHLLSPPILSHPLIYRPIPIHPSPPSYARQDNTNNQPHNSTTPQTAIAPVSVRI